MSITVSAWLRSITHGLALGAIVAAATWPRAAAAESLRCSRGIVAEGDSRVSVIYKCGQPNLSDTFCAPVYYPGTLDIVPEPLASALVPCLVIEQWLYERGPGNLTATVYLRSGVVQSIVYSREPP
ncbi:MAG TPA: DUF2845 domain-containing protein [Ramlibacter sp.]|nr:DUF2845 domain-containing protein [Ramlibacter sp.]